MGKAKQLRIRVRSYFRPFIKLGIKTAALVSQTASIDYIEVLSEIEALLLESRLIRKWLPPYNIASRDDKSPYYIHVTSEKWPKPVVNHISTGALAGPFLSGWVARQILKHFRRIAPFCTTPRRVGRPCLYSHLRLCQPCPNDPHTHPVDYGKNISRLKRLITGQFSQVQRSLKQQMRQAAKIQNFEAASTTRDQLRHLNLLLTQPISPEEYLVNPNLAADKRQEALQSLKASLNIWPLKRIEMYDVANLSGTAATAAMTAALDGEVNSKHYRHFTIKTSGPNDVAMLKETLTRRLKRTDWPRPDLIVLDGGRPQLSIVNSQFSIPVIALAKKEEIIYTLSGEQIRLAKDHTGLQLLQHLRDEAHRFSRRLHHKHRKIV